MSSGIVTQGNDKAGNSYVSPLEGNGQIILCGSSNRFLPGGIRVNYSNVVPGDKNPGIGFAKEWGYVDAVFQDVSTWDCLLIGRFGERECNNIGNLQIEEMKRAVNFTRDGIIEETRPRVSYMTFNSNHPDLASILKIDGAKIVRGTFPGRKVKSLLQVPHAPEQDRYDLAVLLADYIQTKTGRADFARDIRDYRQREFGL